MTDYTLPIILSSNPENGASNVDNNGASFEVNFEQPIIIPKDAITCYIQVDQATVWNNSPNVITGVNDTVRVRDGVFSFQDITIPQGIYTIESLTVAINLAIANSVLLVGPDSISIKGVDSTGETSIEFLEEIQIDFTAGNGWNDILGFSDVLLPPGGLATIGDTFVSGGVASFNTVDYYLLHCDLVSRGIRINNIYTQVIDQIIIDVPPNNQIQSRPFNPVRVPAEELIGESRKNIRIWLTDDKNRFVDTNGEFYSARVVIHYIV